MRSIIQALGAYVGGLLEGDRKIKGHRGVLFGCLHGLVVVVLSCLAFEEVWLSLVKSEGQYVDRGGIELTRQRSVGRSSSRQVCGWS